ncbi:MAG: type II secretion system F family protein, partial [Deltaproteobacteria bacterium]|nr:type II secretion system F family protein [Deltaproteobacteria bacterium]
MPVYEYSALNAKGKKLKGIIDADSIISARQKLRERSIFPTDLRETTAREREERHTKISLGRLFKKVGLREISIMTRQLATLLGAGLPLVPSLAAIVSQTVNPHLKKTMAEIKEEVNEGKSLAESISHYPGIFSAFYVSMVRAGEASGALNIVLDRLADFNERQQALRGKVRAALTYPLFMFIIGSFVMFFMVTFIVPRITGIFEEMNQTLPGITVFLISVSGFLRSFWFVLLLLIAALFAGLRYAFTKTERGQYMWDRIRLRMPLVGPLSHKIAVARFSRTLGTLLESGVPLLSALFIVKNIVNNRLISDVIENARREVEEGQSLSGTLSKSELFPPLTIQMISVGEQSVNIEQMLYKVSDSYEN